jgi:hypothetical protein
MSGASWGIDWLRSGRWRWAAAAWCVLLVAGANAAPAREPVAMSAEARAVFERAKDTLLQLRVIHRSTRARASTGTGFLVTADGLVLTNYHVVSKLALEPEVYTLELERTDGAGGAPRLLAVDVASDLAVLSTGQVVERFLSFRAAAVNKGERGYAMGHPMDLGLTIVEGTYNGFVATAFVPRIHYTGAINPGMSGGPAVLSDGRVFGVNVSRRLDGQLVSFLVPSDRAALLVGRASAQQGAPADFRKEVAAQLGAYQERLFAALLAAPLRTTVMGRYTVPDMEMPFVRCSGHSHDEPERLYDRDTRICGANSDLYVDDGLATGRLWFAHRRYETRGLGAVRFAALLESAYAATPSAVATGASKKELTKFRCHDDFVGRRAGVLRVALCTRAYKGFDGLYDFHLRAMTVDSSTSALLSTLTLSGVSFDTGMRFARQYVEAISWTR